MEHQMMQMKLLLRTIENIYTYKNGTQFRFFFFHILYGSKNGKSRFLYNTGGTQ